MRFDKPKVLFLFSQVRLSIGKKEFIGLWSDLNWRISYVENSGRQNRVDFPLAWTVWMRPAPLNPLLNFIESDFGPCTN